jgi:hypothetical protein
MVGLGMVCAVFLTFGDGSVEPARAEVWQTYEARRSEAGRDAAAHVRLAEWCGANGLEAERAKHLRQALVIDRTNARARELLGLPALDEIPKADEPAADPAALAEYNAKRAKAPKTAEGHWALALWCEQHGLKPEALAHLAEVVRLDPKRELAWKRLGFQNHNGRWMTEAQVQDQADQKKADRTWSKRLKELHHLVHHASRPHPEAAQELAAIDDPRAVPAVFREFAGGKSSDQLLAVQILGQIPTRASSRALASLALFGTSDEVRRRATESLRSRDPLDYLAGMIALLADPIPYEVRPVGGPGSPGVLFVEGEKFNVRQIYAPPPMPAIALQPGDRVSYDEFGMPIISRPVNAFSTSTPVTPGQRLYDPTVADALRQQTRNVPGASALLSSALSQLTAPPLPAPRQIGRDEVLVYSDSLVTNNVFAQQFSVRQAVIESQKAAFSAQAQLEADVAALREVNDARLKAAQLVLGIARDASGQDLGDRPKGWRDWLAARAGSPKVANQPKPTVDQFAALAYNPVYAALPTLIQERHFVQTSTVT